MNQPNITRPSPFSWGLGMRLNVSEKDLYGMIDHINIIHLEHFSIKYSLVKELYFDSFRLSGNEHADICMKHMQLYGVIHYPTLFLGLAVNVATFSQSGKVHCLV